MMKRCGSTANFNQGMLVFMLDQNTSTRYYRRELSDETFLNKIHGDFVYRKELIRVNLTQEFFHQFEVKASMLIEPGVVVSVGLIPKTGSDYSQPLKLLNNWLPIMRFHDIKENGYLKGQLNVQNTFDKEKQNESNIYKLEITNDHFIKFFLYYLLNNSSVLLSILI